MRGQAHTLEAFVGATVLLAGLVFALQVTAVTPLSASTSNQFIENQQSATARGVLTISGQETATERDSALKRAVLYWGDENGDGIREFHCTQGTQVYYTRPPDTSTCSLTSASTYPPNEFGRRLDSAFRTGTAVNVVLTYREPGGGTDTQRMVYEGEPSDNAVRTSTIVSIYDDDVIYDSSGEPTTRTVTSGAADFYAPDAYGSGLYNVVEVEVVVWRI